MTPEGRIVIELFPAAKDAVSIASSRPLSIPRQFSSQAPEQIVQTVSLVFAACRAAQSIAAAEAFEDALGVEAPAFTKKVRAALVLAETAREHALRVLGDWPAFLQAPEQAEAAALRGVMLLDRQLAKALDESGAALRIGADVAAGGDARAAIAQLTALLERAIFRCDLCDWSVMFCGELREWAQGGYTVAQRLMRQIMSDGALGAGAARVSALPNLENRALAERLFSSDADAFIARPEWDGAPARHRRFRDCLAIRSSKPLRRRTASGSAPGS